MSDCLPSLDPGLGILPSASHTKAGVRGMQGTGEPGRLQEGGVGGAGGDRAVASKGLENEPLLKPFEFSGGWGQVEGVGWS